MIKEANVKRCFFGGTKIANGTNVKKNYGTKGSDRWHHTSGRMEPGEALIYTTKKVGLTS